MGKCDRCEGAGYVHVILKARSVGISTMMAKIMDKIPCPKCSGTKLAKKNE